VSGGADEGRGIVEFPDDLKYTDDHEWVSVEASTGTVGITDYAQTELTDIVFVELPQVGDTVARGESFGAIEAIKAVSDLFSPLDGTITEVNENLVDRPDLVNDDPYGEGWMIRIEIADAGQLDELLDAADYEKIIE